MPNDDVSQVRVVVAVDLGAGRKRGWIVRDVGCPDTRHPMRFCRCKVFYDKQEAEAYADSLRTTPQPQGA